MDHNLIVLIFGSSGCAALEPVSILFGKWLHGSGTFPEIEFKMQSSVWTWSRKFTICYWISLLSSLNQSLFKIIWGKVENCCVVLVSKLEFLFENHRRCTVDYRGDKLSSLQADSQKPASLLIWGWFSAHVWAASTSGKAPTMLKRT